MPLRRLIKFFASLRLTVVCLGFGIVLVFLGTLAQVDEGLYSAQNRWFRSFFVINAHIGQFPIPIFPGGYLIGSTLLINLVTAHIMRFKLTWRKSGIFLVHFGLMLLLLGQLCTDMLGVESAMRLDVGDSRNYSEDFHANEVVVTDTTDPKSERVVAIPEKVIAKQGEIPLPTFPLQLRVKGYWPNCNLSDRPPADAKPAGATHGALVDQLILPVAETNPQAQAAALLEIVTDNGSLGTWLVSSRTEEPQRFRPGTESWSMSLVFAPAMGGNFLLFSSAARTQEEQPGPIAASELVAGHEITPANTPFKIKVREFWPHCRLYREPSKTAVVPEITSGSFRGVIIEPSSTVKTMEDRNFPGALVEVVSPKGSLGTWLLPVGYVATQTLDYEGRTYELGMRFMRHYKPFTVTLLEASHKKYRGTDVPKDFRSRVRVQRADTGEVRETEISMNAPLRFAGYTFFQYQMAADQAMLRPGQKPSSTFQVMQNPAWVTPYVSCGLVGLGLVVQFLIHLVGFIIKPMSK